MGSFDAYSSRPSLERLIGIETATARAGEKRLWLKLVSDSAETSTCMVTSMPLALRISTFRRHFRVLRCRLARNGRLSSPESAAQGLRMRPKRSNVFHLCQTRKLVVFFPCRSDSPASDAMIVLCGTDLPGDLLFRSRGALQGRQKPSKVP